MVKEPPEDWRQLPIEYLKSNIETKMIDQT